MCDESANSVPESRPGWSERLGTGILAQWWSGRSSVVILDVKDSSSLIFQGWSRRGMKYWMWMLLGDVVSGVRREGQPFRLSSTNRRSSFPPYCPLGSRDGDNSHDCFVVRSKEHMTCLMLMSVTLLTRNVCLCLSPCQFLGNPKSYKSVRR